MLKRLLIAVVALLALAGFLLVHDWDSPKLGQALLDQVGQATGVSLTASGFRLNLIRGLYLEDVKGSSAAQGRSLSFSLERLVFEHRLAPLLSGTVAIERVLVARPRIEIVETGASAAAGSPPPTAPPSGVAPTPQASAAAPGLALDVKQVRVEDASLLLRSEGAETRVEGLDFTMENLRFDPTAHRLAALSAEGRLAIRAIATDETRVTDAESRFQLAQGVFELPRLVFKTPYGAFAGEMQLDIRPVPFAYSLSAQADPLDLNGLVGAASGFGAASVSLEARGAGPESGDLKADGVVHLTAGRLPKIPTFTGVDTALGKPVLVDSSYQPTEARFRLANDRLTLLPFQFESENARLALEGWADLAGPLDLAFSVATRREGLALEGLGGNVLDVLADDAGWVAVPVSVTGTLEQPKVRPDTKALAAQAAAGAKREAKKAATDALRGLVKKNR